MFGDNTYSEDIKTFKPVLAGEADNLLANEELAVIYIGRATCPYCRKFAKKLGALSSQITTSIYYINSENFDDEGIEDFRAKYGVRTVPGFLVKKQGEVSVICDSSLPEETILEMVK